MSTDQHSTSVEYRDIEGFPGYRIGSNGSIWSRWNNKWGLCETWKRRKPFVTNTGYWAVSLNRDGRTNLRLLHRLLLEAFVGPCPRGMEACHADGNRLNNSLDNLRWDTRKENVADAFRHRTARWGDRHPSTKLTDAQVAEIRKLASEGASYYSLGKRFGVCKQHAGLIAKGLSRKMPT